MVSPYNWGTDTFPAVTADGQLHVDSSFQVHEWQQTPRAHAWTIRRDYRFEKVRSHHLLIRTFVAGSDIFAVGRRPGELGRLWDYAFKLAFVELRHPSTGALFGRRAHMTKAEFLAWLPTVIPVVSGRYNEDAVMYIYEVVDESLNINRVNAWNGLYGSFRGRDCYTGPYGNGRTGLRPRAGYSDGFATYHGTNIEQQLIQYFTGATPVTSQRGVCWMPNNKKTLYRMPKQTGQLVFDAQPGTGRYVWNTSTVAYEVLPLGYTFEFHPAPVTGENPVFIVRKPDTGAVSLLNPSDATLGLRGVFGDDWGCREMMVCYLLRGVGGPAENRRIAFHIKPFGVTKAAMVFGRDVTLTDYDAVVVGKYDSQPRDDTFYVPTEVSGWVEQRPWGEGIRFNRLLQCIAQLTRPVMNGQPTKAGLDSAMTPDRVHFYVRHKLTGLRSDYSKSYIAALRRKCTIPFCYIIKHA